MKLRIFVIDDEENIRDTFKWHLEGLGHEVIALPDPSFCTVYMGQGCSHEVPCADVLIIDYSMPKMTGLRFLELLERKGCLTTARFKMILTGNANLVDRDIAARLGCEVREKPMTITDLEEWVDSLKVKIPKGRKLLDLSKLDLGAG